MFTGNTGKDNLDLYKEHGANGYLQKPVLYDELIKYFECIPY